MSAEQLRADTIILASDIDRNRWKLAQRCWREKLLAHNKQRGYTEHWQAVIAKACRVSERTVWEWAATWEYAEILKVTADVRSRLYFSFFSSAARCQGRISDADMLDLLHTYARDPGATVDSFRAELARLCERVPESHEQDEAERVDRLTTWRADILARMDDYPVAAHEHLRTAAEALERAREVAMGGDPVGLQ